MDKYRLMGKRVKVTKIYQRKKEQIKVIYWGSKTVNNLIEAKENFTGWVVGFRNIPIYFMEYEEGWPFPHCVDSKHVVLVSSSPFTKPLYVPLDGFELLGDENG